eukprot:scaffold210999_cov36-Tisochrysis_lutea.AAC.1
MGNVMTVRATSLKQLARPTPTHNRDGAHRNDKTTRRHMHGGVSMTTSVERDTRVLSQRAPDVIAAARRDDSHSYTTLHIL